MTTTTTKETTPMGLFSKNDKLPDNTSGAITFTSDGTTHVEYYNNATERDRKLYTLRLLDIKGRDVRSS